MEKEQKGEWWSSPAIGDNGGTVIVTGRKDIERFRSKGRMVIRVEITWRYSPLPDGMPDRVTSELMERTQEALMMTFDRDPVAVLTGIFTGDGERTWVFYTASTHIFGRKLNESLAELPQLPIEIYCENDPDWEQYDEMAEAGVAID